MRFALVIVLLLAMALPAWAQVVCTPENGTQACSTRVPVGDYTVSAQACDANGNCATVIETVVPLCSKLEMRQEGEEFVFTWRCKKGMTVTITAAPR